ncbi:hypothetical protein [Thermococcus stetteri]|uniref:hypothetical protein n=1 Tax=Thermococcus stetteri TaxID=49900 RepID=UPI001AE4ED3E|nr:hypothetical protein [Thermococcus stetteri]MBP1912472.1 hypothetical protein [Thermococcus stetteri]
MARRSAQSSIEYLIMIALMLIIVAWIVHHLIGIHGDARKLGELEVKTAKEINKEVGKDIDSALNSSKS